MRRNPLAALLVMGILLVASGGCATLASSPTSKLASTPIPSTVTATRGPLPATTNSSPLPTATFIFTSTVAPTATATDLPTVTPTPSLTPTNTPQYNLKGVYSIGRCMQFGFTYGEPAPGGTGVVSMCILTVQVNKDRSMQFNILWHLVSATGQTPNRYIYGNIDAVYLTDEYGHRYDPIANSGKEPDRDTNNEGYHSTAGWYLFPAPDKYARNFTFHDDDGKSVSIEGLDFRTY